MSAKTFWTYIFGQWNIRQPIRGLLNTCLIAQVVLHIYTNENPSLNVVNCLLLFGIFFNTLYIGRKETTRGDSSDSSTICPEQFSG